MKPAKPTKPARQPNAGGRPRSRQPSPWGRRVERMAADKNLSRRELADRLGITYPSLWALLMGKTRPSLSTAFRLADTLGVSLDKLR